MSVDLSTLIESLPLSLLAPWAGEPPWRLTAEAEAIVSRLLAELPIGDFVLAGGIALHRTATIEMGAILKPPAIVGARAFVAAGAYVRGGVWLDEACSVGPGSEVKSSFLFRSSRLAHFNFVGDSILGADVNLEAGSVIANHRNDRTDREIRVRIADRVIRTGVDKFGALIGDGARIGANAVLAPGTLIARHQVVGRLVLIDQDVDPLTSKT